jgi:hypothetical protein
MDTDERVFTLKDQIAFAEFSGDYNPLHIDPVAARRLMFGAPVVHGVHALLWALEMWLKRHPSPVAVQSMKVVFLKPVMLNTPVSCALASGGGRTAEIILRQGGSVSTRIGVEWTPANHSHTSGQASRLPVRHVPRVLSEGEIATGSGMLDLCLHAETAGRLFPCVTRCLAPSQMAVLLHTSRLVGIECPGLHSLYSELALSADDATACPGLRYEVTTFDVRFAMVLMKITAPGMSGSIKAFVRPAPQAQAAYSSLKGLVPGDEWAGQRALVVGGSRGLGEVTAKLLCAGGADVKLTYHQGEEDARRIVDEIVSAGGRADCLQFDVLQPESDAPGARLGGWSPTHLYYFASPPVLSGTKGQFSTELFTRYCGYYVAGLMTAINRLAGADLQFIFYPSTAFIDEMPFDRGEYAAAKMAGEMLCDFLDKTRSRITVAKPRLPKLATDPIGTLMPLSGLDPVPVLMQALGSVRSPSVMAR